MSKKYHLSGKCPQCGCSAVAHLSAEEIKKRFGDSESLTLECGECMKQFEEKTETACPEYAADCK